MKSKAIWSLVDAVSKSTNCDDREVGCVIYNKRSKQIVATGYNKHVGICDCYTAKTATHAEIRAIANLTPMQHKEDLVAYINHAPCNDCKTALEKVTKEVRYRSQK